MFSVNFATTIHHLFRKGHVSEPLDKSTYSTIIQSSMIGNTHPVPMRKKVSTGHIERQGLIVFPPNVFTSRVMSTIITHAIYIQLDICAQIFPHHMMLAKIKKRNGEKNFDSLHKSKRQALRRGKQRLPCTYLCVCSIPQCKRTSCCIAP